MVHRHSSGCPVARNPWVSWCFGDLVIYVNFYCQYCFCRIILHVSQSRTLRQRKMWLVWKVTIQYRALMLETAFTPSSFISLRSAYKLSVSLWVQSQLHCVQGHDVTGPPKSNLCRLTLVERGCVHDRCPKLFWKGYYNQQTPYLVWKARSLDKFLGSELMTFILFRKKYRLLCWG